MHSSLESKISLYKSKQDDLTTCRLSTFDRLDTFFDSLIARVNSRREQLKSDFKALESKEKRRLKTKLMKLEKDLNNLKSYQTDFSEFLTEFDQEMDFLANKASLDGQVQELQMIEREMNRGVEFYKSSEFKEPTFTYI